MEINVYDTMLDFYCDSMSVNYQVCFIFDSLSAIVCVFFTVGHHHNHESLARRAAIIALIKNFTIDLLDTVDILEVLFETEEDHEVSALREFRYRLTPTIFVILMTDRLHLGSFLHGA